MHPIWELPLQATGMLVELENGGRVRIRPARADDMRLLQEGFTRLSDESRYLRFFTPRARLDDGLAASLTDIDHRTHFAWGVFDPDRASNLGDDSGLGVAAARLILDDDGTSAEAALTVVDEYHGHGIGRFLVELLAATAADLGVDTLRFEILRQNRAMIALAAGMGATRHAVPGDMTIVEYRLAVPPPSDDALPIGALYELLRSAPSASSESDADLDGS